MTIKKTEQFKHVLKNSDVSHPLYDEVSALQQLLQAIDITLKEMNDQFDATDDYSHLDRQIIINIGGISTAILFGGPQTQALCDFISAIADENSYTVDFKNSTVI